MMLTSRDSKANDTVVALNGARNGGRHCGLNDVRIGGRNVVVMAGPCAVEDRDQMREVAAALKGAGVKILRGGAFKPRSSPYSFQGLGRAGLDILAEVRDEFGLAVVTEVMTAEDVPLVAHYADILQVGSRNMQNFALLQALGRIDKPVLLKRGMMSTVEELLLSAEYILAGGNGRVMLCERGIRTFESYTRNTFDLNAIPALKQLTHLPVIADPSHATGRWELVAAVARAAVAAGADGLLVEVHPHPGQALSDGAQSLKPETFGRMMAGVQAVAHALGRDL
jgi:3-deoxy-7-phosphoheptulonate synthase